MFGLAVSVLMKYMTHYQFSIWQIIKRFDIVLVLLRNRSQGSGCLIECNYRSLECICQALSNKLKAAFHPLYFYLTCCMAVDHQLCTKDSLSDNGPKRLLQPTEPLSGQATNPLLQYVFGPHLPSAAFLIGGVLLPIRSLTTETSKPFKQ